MVYNGSLRLFGIAFYTADPIICTELCTLGGMASAAVTVLSTLSDELYVLLGILAAGLVWTFLFFAEFDIAFEEPEAL